MSTAKDLKDVDSTSQNGSSDTSFMLPKPKERVLWNTIAIMSARFISGIFSLLASFKMAKYLGKKDWGLFGYLGSTIEVFRVLTTFGLDLIGLRIMALGTRKPREVIYHLNALKIFFVLMGFVVLAIVSGWLEGCADRPELLFFMSIVLIPDALTGSATVRFQAEHVMDRIIPLQVIAGALYLGAVYTVAALGYGVSMFVSVSVAMGFMGYFLTTVASRWTWKESLMESERIKLDFQLAFSIFKQGIPVGALVFIVVLYSRLGIFFLEKFGNLEAVGLYFIAIRISEPLLAVASALSTSSFPVLSRLAEKREIEDLKKRFLLYSGRALLLSCSVATIIMIFSDELLCLIKQDYLPASGALISLAWATAFMFQNQLSSTVINAFGKYHYVTAFAAINLCTYLAFSLTLIPKMGTTGAGLATLGTEGINTVMQLVTVFFMLKKAKD